MENNGGVPASMGGGRHRASDPDDSASNGGAVTADRDDISRSGAAADIPTARPTRLEDLTRGARVRGVTGTLAEVSVIDVQWIGSNAVTVTYRSGDGSLGDAILYRDQEPGLRLATSAKIAAFDGDASDFKLALEAKRIKMAARFDPMLAVATSDVEPLPHQLKAVYGELLPKTPLRFLLADDPGAGKTIMAGLYIKELILRGDLERCLIVVPGGLTDQWQAELHEKFGLDFEILTRDMVEQSPDGLDRHRLLIAKMDQLARAEDLQLAVEQVQWDLVIVDEAHRMSAHYQGQERKYTKRYQLGQVLGGITRHLLLMTATPHAGKEEDFQLFLALLDADRFEGRYRDGVHSIDTTGLMRRMVKEELLTFEGKPLFPERRAYTVPYQLSAEEHELYELVTQYVREEMNRADRLKAEGEGRRGNTVGFALTVLQRRLASSPEAIWRSLQRRRKRLERTKALLANQGTDGADLATRLRQALGVDPTAEVPTDDDLEELTGEEQERLEEDVVDAATAAKTLAELDVEIGQLAELEELARRLRQSGADTKWTELRELLTKNDTIRDASGNPRKIIIFTEHRDTLNYLVERIRTLLGGERTVISIHGGVKREDRSKAQELFSQDKGVTVLVATDAAGEGLNLQRAHLMVNYDLPWNPNRLEQRFGRIHRIGQTEVCHLWNLVAADTREGAVFERLLDKIEQMRTAYAGKVFDVLGEAFTGTPLRDLLVRAIRYGDQPDVRAQLDRIIDANVADGIEQLLAERALNRQVLDAADVNQMRLAMEEARARRLQPHYIRAFFDKALTELGGRVAERESGRFEVTHVPQLLRDRDRQIGTGAPVLRRYERITFDRTLIRVPGRPQAELIAPGHPLLDALIDVVIERHGQTLKHGAVLVDPAIAEPRLLAAVTSSLADGRGRRVSQRFDFVTVDPDGRAQAAGPAPYLDYEMPSDAQRDAAMAVTSQPWLGRSASGAENRALAWGVEHGAREHLQQVQALTAAQTQRTEQLVSQRLRTEINHWDMRSLDLADKEAQGKSAKMSAEYAGRRARDLERRLERRLAELTSDAAITARPPEIAALAVVVPPDIAGPQGGDEVPVHARNTEEVDRRAVAAVIAAERALGRTPTEQAHNNPGFDIASVTADSRRVITIEVKGRIEGADEVTITRTEVFTAKNKGVDHRLALVKVSPDRPEHDEVRYLVDPFAAEPDPAFDTTRITKSWRALWERGTAPE